MLLENPLYQDSIRLFALQDSGLSIETLQEYLGILENITSLSNDWRIVSKVMETVKDTFACFDTNRLVAVENELELEKLATKLFENATFLVGK